LTVAEQYLAMKDPKHNSDELIKINEKDKLSKNKQARKHNGNNTIAVFT